MPDKPQFSFQTGYGAGSTEADSQPSGDYGFRTGYGTNTESKLPEPLYQKAADWIEKKKVAITPKILTDVVQNVGSQSELQPINSLIPSIPQGNPLQQVLGAARQTVGFPFRVGATISTLPDVLGQGASDIGESAGYPKTGAAVGTAIKMAPYVTLARVGWNAMQQSANPVVRGLVNTPQELSPQYTAQNKLIGISDRMPESLGGKTIFPNPYSNTLSTKPPPALNVDTNIQSNLRGAEPLPSTTPMKYPSNNEVFVNYANKRLAFGDKLNPQELSDIKYKADGAITDAKDSLRSNPSDKAAKTLLARASAIRSQSNTLLNQVASKTLPTENIPSGTIPTRPGLNTAYGIASRQKAIQDLIKSLPKYMGYGGGAIGGLAGAGYAIKNLYNYLSGER